MRSLCLECSFVIVILSSIHRTEEIVYSTERCPLVHLHVGEDSVRQSSLCCESESSPLKDCRDNGSFVWSETEVPLANLSEYRFPNKTLVIPTDITRQDVKVELKSHKKRAKYAHLYPISDWKNNGWLDDDFESVINDYWMGFPPPSHEAHYAFASVYLVLTIVGLSGNVLVFMMIVKFKVLRTPSNFLVANLAVADFFMMSRGPIFIYNCLRFGPFTGYIGCQLYGVVGGMTGVGAIMSLAFIAKDRYSVIVHPFDPAYKLTKTKAALSITFIWIYAAVFATIPLTGTRLGIKPYVPEGYLTSCSFDYVNEDPVNRTFIFTFFLAAWFVPMTIITTSYYKICRHVLSASVTRIGQEKQQRKGELRLAAVVVLVIAVWFFSWTPYATVALLGITGNRHLLTPFSTMVPAVFCKTAASVDPFLYAINHPRFRNLLFKVWCPKKYEERRADEFNNQIAIWRSGGSLRFMRKDSSGNNITIPTNLYHP